MKSNYRSRIQPKSYEEIFNSSEDEESIAEIPLNLLHSFHNHPFRVLEDEAMQELKNSIAELGVINPGIVRKRTEGGYEIISGHRRVYASRMLGRNTIPMMIKELSDEDAVKIMVDSNFQRENLLPSEKAKSYRMKFDLIKGKHTDTEGSNLDAIGAAYKESGKTVQRYIALSYLTPELLDMVDSKKLGMKQGVEISAMNEATQGWVLNGINETKVRPTLSKAKKLKKLYRAGKLTENLVKAVLLEQTGSNRVVTLKSEQLEGYFEEDATEEDILGIILQLLDRWKQEDM